MRAPTLLYGRELCARIGISYGDLMALRREGVIEAIRMSDGSYCFNLDRVVKAIRAQKPEGSEVTCAS
jgi:predicted site-specific integrase-resolvase